MNVRGDADSLLTCDMRPHMLSCTIAHGRNVKYEEKINGANGVGGGGFWRRNALNKALHNLRISIFYYQTIAVNSIHVSS